MVVLVLTRARELRAELLRCVRVSRRGWRSVRICYKMRALSMSCIGFDVLSHFL